MNLEELIFLKIDFTIIYPRQDCTIFVPIFSKCDTLYTGCPILKVAPKYFFSEAFSEKNVSDKSCLGLFLLVENGS